MSHTSSSSVVRVLVVDDHLVMRRALGEEVLRDETLYVCGEAADAAGALENLLATSPDVVLLDLSLKGCDGIELIKQIRACSPSVKVLVVSMHEMARYGRTALEAGASGYLDKGNSAGQLTDAIHTVASGGVYPTELLDQYLRKK